MSDLMPSKKRVEQLKSEAFMEIEAGNNTHDGSSDRDFKLITTRKWDTSDAMAWQAHKGYIPAGYSFMGFRIEQVAADSPNAAPLYYAEWKCYGSCD